MLTIQLHNLIFYGHHGVHAEEQLTANGFEVNLEVSYDEKGSAFNQLSDTIDYVALYKIVKDDMRVVAPLMEKVCETVIDKIKKQFPVVSEISISIKKLNAPIGNFQGNVGVSLKKKFD
ncbi:MAG: dihydroneopterin aldolase [Bacteroidetes bacterium]|nr:dihydroneopterin aldolase [Bacteroidota bacterium]MBS1974544.1 dihydroneopterin aldolase [Bacteroidota bacterium]